MADNNDGVFNFLDPNVIRQQEQAQQAQLEQQMIMRAAQFTPQQTRVAAMAQSGNQLGELVGKATGQQPTDSPAVVRATKLQEAFNGTKGIVDAKDRLNRMAQVLSEAGLTDDANKMYQRIKDMELADSTIALNKAKTAKEMAADDPAGKMLELLIKNGYTPKQAQEFAQSYNKETGKFDGGIGLEKQADGTYAIIYDAAGNRIQKGLTGKNAGEEKLVVGAKKGPETVVNVNTGAVTKDIDLGFKFQDQVGKYLEPYAATAAATSSALSAVKTASENPNNSAAGIQALESWKQFVSNSKTGGTAKERANIAGVGDLFERVQGSLSKTVTGRPSNEQLAQIYTVLKATEQSNNAKANQVRAALRNYGVTAGLSGAVVDSALDLNPNMRISNDLKGQVGSVTTSPNVGERSVQSDRELELRGGKLAKDNAPKEKALENNTPQLRFRVNSEGIREYY